MVVARSAVTHAPSAHAMPSAALTHTVAAVVRPSTVRAAVSLRMTPAPMKLIPAMTPWMAHGVGVLGHARGLNHREAGGSCSERHQAQGAHAHRLLCKIPVQADEATSSRCREKPNYDIPELESHRLSFVRGVDPPARRCS
jgi:hypothetical protein